MFVLFVCLFELSWGFRRNRSKCAYGWQTTVKAPSPQMRMLCAYIHTPIQTHTSHGQYIIINKSFSLSRWNSEPWLSKDFLLLFSISSFLSRQCDDSCTCGCVERGCNSFPRHEPPHVGASRGLHTWGQLSSHDQQHAPAQSCSPSALQGTYSGFPSLLSCKHFYDSNQSLTILEISFRPTLPSWLCTMSVCICNVNNSIYYTLDISLDSYWWREMLGCNA